MQEGMGCIFESVLQIGDVEQANYIWEQVIRYNKMFLRNSMSLALEAKDLHLTMTLYFLP